ncbi:hypothetical protein PF005_g5050 [Phytophthora fragariae]|uniref:Anaphase-promoting complex subunit 4 WD40 domain-containing protein n=1 Tax=Phytophthora fragariae TaxID=53985 RepID=A0A6A3FKP2_9STRA|nr:hypothetical protein PF009_g5059 [Phytophthora fragariae]KAE9129031.1 hypothetical protein PF007_g5062 [Phytophthora fragariae]KAE9226623.1 hypothetical protein PF005_g5050 [Phytophthora fragariae]KAE9323151.1 hypothetical protein PF001_g4043 [Phytophthora fragariae]
MELLADAVWQWRPRATLTAADSCDRCTVFALQYSDCAVLRVRWNADNLVQTDGYAEPQVGSEPLDRDLELHGHAERVVCVKIYAKDCSAVNVCSASRDCVIVWHITGRSRVAQSILVENLPSEPGWVAFDDTGKLAAVASERDVKIFVIERKEVLVTLEGHLARVTKGEFHPIHHHLLVTASEDRTFKIWDLATRTLWFQSAVLSAFSILSIALNPVNGDAAFGFADGSVKIFALLDRYAKELTAFNVENFMRKSLRKIQETEDEARQDMPQVISSLPPWARSQRAQKNSTGVSVSASYGSVDGIPQSDEDQVGSDRTSRIWLADSDACSLTLEGIAPPSDIAAAAAAMGSMSMSSAKKATRQEIVEARFFYMDKFLLSACGNLVRLHQFELDEAFARASSSKAKPAKKKNDVEILENRSCKKRVAQWSFGDMQSVTSLACVNGAFLSSVAVLAGSDRSIRVLDIGAGGGGRTVRVVRDAHSRAAHTVALPRPTCYTSHPSNFYDLMLSSAADSTTHLWDIRADNCVMRFCEHVNRVHTLGVAFSPCMRYVATGSEDRAAYIYDIRTGRRLVKIKGHSEVVTSVAFNPLHPQLATASIDGTVRFYSSKRSD